MCCDVTVVCACTHVYNLYHAYLFIISQLATARRHICRSQCIMIHDAKSHAWPILSFIETSLYTDRLLITGYYAKLTSYTSIGVSAGKGAEALLSGNQWLPPPSHPTKMEEPQTAVSPLLGLISVAYWWYARMTSCSLHPRVMDIAGFSELPMSQHGSGRDSGVAKSWRKLAATVLVVASVLLHAAKGGFSPGTWLQLGWDSDDVQSTSVWNRRGNSNHGIIVS